MEVYIDSTVENFEEKGKEWEKLLLSLCELTVREELKTAEINEEDLEELEERLEVSVLVTDNKGIREINQKHRGIDSPTDVLSFPMYEGKEELLREIEYEENVPLGDIVISLDKVKEQAKEYGHSERREFGYLLVHGLLHLFGYDHMEETEKEVMRKREEELLNKLSLTRD